MKTGQKITREELLEKIFHKDFEELKGQTLRMTRVRIPGKEVCLAHVLNPSDPSIYQNLGLHGSSISRRGKRWWQPRTAP